MNKKSLPEQRNTNRSKSRVEKTLTERLIFAYPFDTEEAIRKANGLGRDKAPPRLTAEKTIVAGENKIVAKEEINPSRPAFPSLIKLLKSKRSGFPLNEARLVQFFLRSSPFCEKGTVFPL